MKTVHCPLCDAQFIIEFDGKKYDEHDISVRVSAHIKRHSIESILYKLDDIWASEYNRIIKEPEK
jgi:hypothetical protein